MTEGQVVPEAPLLPERHPNRDFFIADVFDNLPIKDDLASMEHPIFSLSTKPDHRNLEYNYGNTTVSIKPTSDGLPTIHDKDVLLYCCSQLMNAINKGDIPQKTLRISTHDLLVATNRNTNGEGYKLLKKALDRLSGVRVKTNIKTNKREYIESFGLIEGYRIVESSRVKDRMIRLEVTLSDWFYNSILGKEVVSISRDYFRLRRPMERRLYEIARKHCGSSPKFQIGLEKLQRKIGSTTTERKFRYFINQIVKNNHLPEYNIALSSDDIVMFTQKHAIKTLEHEEAEVPLSSGRREGGLLLKSSTYEKAKQIAPGLDIYALEADWKEWIESSGMEYPESPDGAFLGFCKKKYQDYPK